jgi:hypothetical protein
VSGSIDETMVPTVTRVELTPEPPGRARAVLGVVALACALIYGTLLVVERRMSSAPALPVLTVSEPIALVVPETPDVSADTDADSREQMAKVVDALTWLGTHSLNEYRLTAPPKDNAFYYFTRLAQLDPGNEAARVGLTEISARYALLAEREIAAGNHERARDYVDVGLQIDPGNSGLKVLRDLAVPEKRSLLASMIGMFK